MNVPLNAMAAVQSSAPVAKVSFTFDDGLASAATQAAPTLQKYGLSGTSYVSTGCVGMTKIPNTCRANTSASYMSWAQVLALQNTYGWEIGSHTVSHPYLATSDATDGQPNVLTPAQVTTELTQSKADLAARGINATDFASPYGDYNNAVMAQVAKLYASQRGFGDVGTNSWPYSDYLIRVMQVQGGVTVAQVMTAIDQAVASKQWLVLVMHDIKVKPSNKPADYEFGTAQLDQIARYVKTKQTAGSLQSVNVNRGLVTSDINLLPNASFNNGIGDGWTTDSPSTITKDVANNGSYPDAVNSLKLVSASSEQHLYSPMVAVNPNTTYMLKNFLNVQTNLGGEVAFYVDEYDTFGNWISGQYKAAERGSFVESMNFSYKPTSPSVTKSRLQVIISGNAGITAYLDNAQWFPLQTETPPPTQSNLLTNGNFDSGISSGWSTDDPIAIVADSGNNGSPANPVNSVKLSSSTKSIHLFSPKVTVDTTKTYSLSAYLNLKQITGAGSAVGLYMDEYDAAGNWISGQYKAGASVIGAGNVRFSYKPSSVSVAKSSLQVIVAANSNTLAYFDDVVWY